MSNQPIFNKFKQDCIAKINEAVAKFDVDLNPADIDIRFDVSGRTAGVAGRKFGRYYLRFNLQAVVDHNDILTNNTIPHEVAHLVCFANKLYGTNHNDGWKSVCRRLGGDGERCIDLPLERSKTSVVRRFEYVVQGHIVSVGPKHHKKLQDGASGYTCVVPHLRDRQRILGHMWTGGGQQIVREAGPAAKAANAAQPAPAHSLLTKRERALAIFQSNRGIARGEMIKLFVAGADMTPAGAATYYQTFKKDGL